MSANELAKKETRSDFGSRNQTWFLWAVPAVATWLFAVSTLCALAYMIVSLWPPGSDGASHMFGSKVNGVLYTGLGFEYRGTAGLLLAGTEALAVISGLILSLHPAALPRRTGHLILSGWCALWLGNAIHVAGVDAYFRRVWLEVAGGIAAFLACTIAWTARRW